MTSKLISLSIAALALTASASSFAAASTAEYNYPAETSFMSQKSRAEVQAEALAARAFLALPESAYGSVALDSNAMSKITRDQVRMEASEFARTHKATDEVRG